jgi:hypothetical protein
LSLWPSSVIFGVNVNAWPRILSERPTD